jgi:F0F1-type ATP synthase assembly protein I
MAAQESKSKSLALSVVIGIGIGTLAAILSSHVAVWLIAGLFLGVAAGASISRTKCPACEAREQMGFDRRGTSHEPGVTRGER